MVDVFPMGIRLTLLGPVFCGGSLPPLMVLVWLDDGELPLKLVFLMTMLDPGGAAVLGLEFWLVRLMRFLRAGGLYWYKRERKVFSVALNTN